MRNTLPPYTNSNGEILHYNIGDVVVCFKDEAGDHLYIIEEIDVGATRGFHHPYDDNKFYSFRYFDFKSK
jgi:hypothetical protein